MSFVFVTVNLLIWLPILLVVGLLRLLPFAGVRHLSFWLVDTIYRTAVIIDNWWFFYVLRIRVDIQDERQVLERLDVEQTPVIICNHQSWFDIFLLQALISTRGPALKFVIKTELLWVPVLGWVCFALNLPRLSRKGDAQSRARDLDRVGSASIRLAKEPGGLLIFPEGTRFSEAKRLHRQSAYRQLLPPKAGGLAMIQASVPANVDILDISVGYPTDGAICWECMGGAVTRINVRVASFPLQDTLETASWLTERWYVKDTWLENMSRRGINHQFATKRYF